MERAAAEMAARLTELGRAAGEARRAELGGIAAAAVAHEVRNLLTPVRARLELALGELGDRKVVERAVREALKGVERAGRAAEAVLSVVAGRAEVGQGADVAEATNVAAGWVEGAGFLVERGAAGGVKVAMGQVALEQVMLNLFLNARAAVGGRGTIVVRIIGSTKTWVVIEVVDRGVGVVGGLFRAERESRVANRESGAASRQSRVGSRESRVANRPSARSERRGGVGLVVCRHLVEAVGGEMSARPRVGGGTVVRVELPGMGERAGRAAA